MKEKNRVLLVSGEYITWPLAVMVSNFTKPSFTLPRLFFFLFYRIYYFIVMESIIPVLF